MFIQKLKIIVPDEVNELVCRTNQYRIKFDSDEINRLNRKLIIYRTFDFNCKHVNSFELYLNHTFHYSFNIPFEYYVAKLECEITFNESDDDFKFTINGEEW